MAITYEIKTTSAADDRLAIRRAMSHMHTGCGSVGAFRLGPESASMGWTFFSLEIDDTLTDAMVTKFADMINRYRGKAAERLDSFMADYFTARGCGAKISRVD